MQKEASGDRLQAAEPFSVSAEFHRRRVVQDQDLIVHGAPRTSLLSVRSVHRTLYGHALDVHLNR